MPQCAESLSLLWNLRLCAAQQVARIEAIKAKLRAKGLTLGARSPAPTTKRNDAPNDFDSDSPPPLEPGSDSSLGALRARKRSPSARPQPRLAPPRKRPRESMRPSRTRPDAIVDDSLEKDQSNAGRAEPDLSRGRSVSARSGGRGGSMASSAIKSARKTRGNAKTLEDLFRRTAAKPPLYWLPLTEDEVKSKNIRPIRRSCSGGRDQRDREPAKKNRTNDDDV